MPPAAFRLLVEEDQPDIVALDLAAQYEYDANFDALPQREQEGRLCSSLGAVKFYARSGHSFVAVRGGVNVGFALAQTIWQGDDSIVLVRTIITSPTLTQELRAEIYNGLLRAIFKSAFDTATYQIHFCPAPNMLPANNDPNSDAPDHDLGQIRTLGPYAVRYLGSRDETAPDRAL